MQWRDEAVILGRRPHGESAVILDLLTAVRGRHAGLVRGGASARMTPMLQPGTQVDATWTARLEDHLGTLKVEPVRSRAATLMSDRAALAGLNAVCGLLTHALPEREACPDLYGRTVLLLDLMGESEAWPLAYLRWELALLDELGFGLDLSSCAVTGRTVDLAYVSPRTGRAVSNEAAGEWSDRLLPLPPALLGQGSGPPAEILAGLETTGYFLHRRLGPALGGAALPEARDRLVSVLRRQAEKGG